MTNRPLTHSRQRAASSIRARAVQTFHDALVPTAAVVVAMFACSAQLNADPPVAQPVRQATDQAIDETSVPPVSQTTFLGPTDAGINAGFSTPVEKQLDPNWKQSLFERGQRKIYRADELKTIGMPCGGIGAGQLYVRGDGTLARWLIFGRRFNTHWGKLQNGKPREYGYHTYRPASRLQQGFALQLETEGQPRRVLDLSQKDFDDIQFVGEFPIAEVRYRRSDQTLPVEVDLEVFTPWIPLAARESAYPATVMRFTITNQTDQPQTASLAGWLENGVGKHSKKKFPDARLTGQVKRSDQLTFLSLAAASDQPGFATVSDFGTMGLGLMGAPADIQSAQISSGDADQRLSTACFDSAFEQSADPTAEAAINKRMVGCLGRRVVLPAKGSAEITFVVAWHFPHFVNPDDRGKTGAVGRKYANWFDNAADVAKNLTDNFKMLDQQTHLFRDTYFDTTLPYWFVHRIAMPASTLSTLTSQWWKNDRFYNYEGVGFCAGSCTHVYAYSQAMARLFPSLERNIRLRQDLCQPGQDPETGRVNFRGRDFRLGEGIHASGYAADGQCAVVLRAYREHLLSPNNEFLDAAWPNIKLAMEFMIDKDAQDGQTDGIIEVRQHSTWDTDFYGANTYTGALYLGALAACEQMATVKQDLTSAERYRTIKASGSALSVEKLWNGDYFIQTFPENVKVVPSKSWGEVAVQYQNGCFSNQLFGQNYSSQLGLGYLYPQPMVRKTLRSIHRYNWLPAMKHLYRNGKPYKYVMADEDEAGLLQGSWPLDKRPVNAVKLTEHIWTGFEYQVASHMLHEGLTEEAFSIVRGIHDRYDGVDHNPWNEIEGGDHYGRAMASWGCLTAISGFQYNGPAGALGFAPTFQQNDFRAFFSAAEGWGSLTQKRDSDRQTNRVELKFGKLTLNQLQLQFPADNSGDKQPRSVDVRVGDQPVEFDIIVTTASGDGAKTKDAAQATATDPASNAKTIKIIFDQPVTLTAGDTISVSLDY